MSIQDLSEAEKQAEVLPIRVQQLYVATLLGKTEEANKLASEIPIQEYFPFENLDQEVIMTLHLEYLTCHRDGSLRTMLSPQSPPLPIPTSIRKFST